jgi:hypothetical protein
MYYVVSWYNLYHLIRTRSMAFVGKTVQQLLYTQPRRLQP